MRVAICLIAWNNLPYTTRCLNSVASNSVGHNLEYFLLDNGSTDQGTYNYLASMNPTSVTRNMFNKSVYAGWNEVLGAALERHKTIPFDAICLLSNDVEVGPRWLDGIAREIKDPALRYWLPNGPASHEQFLRESEFPNPEFVGKTTDALAAWCLFFTPECVRDFFPFPEDLKLWYGDNYLHLELRGKGYKPVAVMDCNAFHFLSKTFYATPDYVAIVARDKEIFNEIARQKGWETIA